MDTLVYGVNFFLKRYITGEVCNGFAKESDNSWERFAETFSSIRSSIIYLMEAISFYYCLTMCVLTSES